MASPMKFVDYFNHELLLMDDKNLYFGNDNDISIDFTDGTGLQICGTGSAENLILGSDTYAMNVTLKGTLTFGADGAGNDFKFYGDTSGVLLEWDADDDRLEGTNTSIQLLSTDDKTAAFNSVYAYVDTGGSTGWTSGNVVAGRFKASTDGTGTIADMTGVWAGLLWASGFTASGIGLTCAINAEVNTACASGYGHPNAILYLQSLPTGASSSHATMPYIVFSETATGTGSNILFECGHEPAGTTVTSGSGKLFNTTTLQIKVNGSARYIPLSTAENTLTTAGNVALTGTLTTGASGTGVDVKFWGDTASMYWEWDADLDTMNIVGGWFNIGTQGAGTVVVNDYPNVMEVHALPGTALTAGLTGASTCIRARYEVGAAQTNTISIRAIDARLRPKAAMAAGVHCGIQGSIECDAVAFTGDSNTMRAGGSFTLDMATGTTLASGWLCGVSIDSAVHGDVNVSGVTFAGLRISVGSSKEAWTHGIYISDAVTAITITGATTAISADAPITTTSASTGAISVTATQTSATPGTIRGIYSKETTHSSMTSGNVVGVRGEVTVGGTVSTGVYLYGTQGKLIGGSNTITAGNGMVCGIYGQLDVSGTTIASGWVSAIHADIYGANSGSIDINLISATHAGGGVINALLSLFGKSDYVFDISSNTHDNVATTGTVTTDDGYIKVLIDGSTRYIGLGSAVA